MLITNNEYKILKAQFDACYSAYKKENGQWYIQLNSLKTITEWLCHKHNFYVDFEKIKEKILNIRGINLEKSEFEWMIEEVKFDIYELLKINND